MEHVNKKIILVALIITQVTAGTGLDSILSSSSGSFDFAGESSLKTQTRSYYSFGGLAVRSDFGGTIRPFSIEMPTISSGCGGVDIGFGGFSFLNIDQLVEKLQKIASAAPAFAFNMALSALCKDCQAIMDQLNAVADAINGLNFDACKSAVNWGKAIGGALNKKLDANDDTLNTISDTVKNTSSAITSWASDLQAFINCDGGTCIDTSSDTAKQKAVEKERFQGSFLKKVLSDNSSFLSEITSGQNENSTYSYWFKGLKDEDAEALFRNMIGDLFGYVESANCEGKDSEGAAKGYNVMPIPPKMSAQEAVRIFLGAENGTDGTGELRGLFISEPSKVCNYFFLRPNLPEEKTLSTTFNAASIRNSVKEKITEILAHMQENNTTALKNDASKISGFRFPVYRALNVASITNDTLLIDYIADYVVSQEIVGLVNEMLRKARTILILGGVTESTKLATEEKDQYLNIEKRIVEINKEASKVMTDVSRRMQERLGQVNVLEDTMKRLKHELARKGIQRFER